MAAMGGTGSGSKDTSFRRPVHVVSAELRSAVRSLSSHGLNKAAVWASQMLVGLTASPPSASTAASSTDMHPLPAPEHASSGADSDDYLLAKCYLDTQEFLRAAHALSSPVPFNGVSFGTDTSSSASSASKVGIPKRGLSPKEFFVRAYALYMAGERQKEQEAAEMSGPLERCNTAINRFLPELLEQLRERGTHDHYSLYIHGVCLKAKGSKDAARSKFLAAVNMYPLNWSAWLDLGSVCTLEQVHEMVREKDSLPQHWTTHAFLAHFLLDRQQPKEAMAHLDMLSKVFVTSSFVQGLVARCHYNAREFDEAEAKFALVQKLDPFRLDDMEILSNILYVKEARAQLSVLAHRAIKLNKYRPETCCIIGNYYSLRGEHEKAVLNFGRALTVDRNFLSAWTLMGHEFVEMKNTPAATQAYRIAIDINPSDYRAWYGLGQTYELLRLFNYAIEYYGRATALRPFDSRMWCALAGCYENLDLPWDAVQCYKRAHSHDDKEGVAAIRLARLFAGLGKDAAAHPYYLHHYMTRVETSNDQGEDTAEALLFLANYSQHNGLLDDAEMYASRILTLPFPSYLSEAKALLRAIRSHKDKGVKPGAKAAAALFGYQTGAE